MLAVTRPGIARSCLCRRVEGKQGGEGVFTVIPNFLVTGVVSTLLGVFTIVWSVRFMQQPHGPVVSLWLDVASFLTGDGVAQVVLYTLT